MALYMRKARAAIPGLSEGVRSREELERLSDNPFAKKPQALTAVLHVEDGGLYSINFCGELVVRGSRDPEFDLSRALVRRGLRGKILDAITGKHRSTITDIEKAAKLCTKEGPLRFAKLSLPDRAPSPESVRHGERHGPSTQRGER